MEWRDSGIAARIRNLDTGWKYSAVHPNRFIPGGEYPDTHRVEEFRAHLTRCRKAKWLPLQVIEPLSSIPYPVIILTYTP
jgi:hypothetical protein